MSEDCHQEQKPKEPGTLAKMKKFFSFKKGISPSEEFQKFRSELLESPKALIVIGLGPSRSGKSTLLNFLTVKGYPFLNK